MKQAPVVAEVERFFSDPNHPYAHNLRQQMATLLRAGHAETLEQAYEMAAYANPETRALLISQQQQGSARQAAERARAAASNARAAARSVTGSPLAGASTTPSDSGLSLEDQLRAAWESARA